MINFVGRDEVEYSSKWSTTWIKTLGTKSNIVRNGHSVVDHHMVVLLGSKLGLAKTRDHTNQHEVQYDVQIKCRTIKAKSLDDQLR